MAVERPIAEAKVKIEDLINEDNRLTKLIYSYLVSATAWLIFGTLVGLYLAVRFIYPDFGVAAWLSFGRLRPIHTNVVFWGWTSLAMITLSLYVIPHTSQRPLFSIVIARRSLYVINISILAGVIYCLWDIITEGKSIGNLPGR